MPRVMFKYTLMENGKFRSTVKLPSSAIVRHVAVQDSIFGEGIMAWAEVVNEEHLSTHEFVLIATGEGVLDNWKYIKTLEFASGTIFHLYEILKY